MKLKITVHGVAYEVDVEVLDPGDGFLASSPLPPAPHRVESPPPGATAATATAAPGPSTTPDPASTGDSTAGIVASPIAGVVVEVKCSAGDSVDEGQILLIVEAMKMNTSIASPAAGTIGQVLVAAGDSVREGQTLVEFE